MKKEKVLIVHNYYQIPGGEDTVVTNEKKLLEDNGHEVILYSRSNSEIKDMSKLRKIGLAFTTVFNLKTYREIKRIIRSEHIDIVHVHNTLSLISPSVYYAAVSCKVPVVQTIHNFRMLCPGATFYRDGHICEDCVEHGLGCAIKHSCYRESKAQTLLCVISTKLHRMAGIYGKLNYICLTEFNKEKLLSLKQIKADKIFVKPNFVESIENYNSLDGRENRIIFSGRLDKLKGVDIMLEAWKLMGSNAPKLVICGIGPMEEWCRKYIAENNLNAEMLGFVPNKEVRRLMADSKAMILPTQWYEGFPMSIAEAFSVGTPVITSDIGNAGSLVTEGVTGLHFQYDSSDSLIKAVNKLDDKKWMSREYYDDNLTENKNYEMLMSIYSKAKT